MSKAVSIAKEQVSAVIEAAMKKAMTAGMLPEAELPAFTVERPADRSHGDFATNAAMASARAFRMAPPKIAAAIMENLDLNGTYFVKAETAGPGFMNFFLGSTFYSDVLTEVLTKDSAYGRSDYGNHRKVMVEFVSANPTGPMHMGNARGGALGDCLASVLDAAGYDVWREFYVNDAGNQLDKFGLSLSIRYQQLFAENPPELPEDSYHGEDILDLAKEYAKEHGDELMHVTEEERRKALVGFGLPKNIAKMKADMEKYRVHYDRWFLESDLHKDGEVMAVVNYLRDRGLTYEKDGAVWYKATEFGGEKDEVLVRANGNPTYFTADIAYHKNKFDRGFDLLIDIWGSDHHGHVARMKGAMDAIGQSADKLDIILMQFVRFQKAADGTFFAAVEPQFNALPLAVDHFKDRFADQRWLIYDVKRQYGYYYNLTEMEEVTFEDPRQAHLVTGMLNETLMDNDEKLFQKLWKTYFKSICIKERWNPRKHRQDMPVRYWKYLTEKQ